MKKSNLSVLLILLMGILTFVSCSSGDDSNNTNSSSSNNNNNSSGSGGDEIVYCLWDKGSDGKMCAKIYGLHWESDKCGSSGSAKMVKSCPSNPDKTCLMIGTIEGKEYNIDWLVYGSDYSSQSCEVWVKNVSPQPARLR